ncbi:hypothetical protein FJZ33_02960 [Candidatus Poribacteria bacterium]|nr:hypothetical protein [Candidatus Poribacteria bacterium]
MNNAELKKHIRNIRKLAYLVVIWLVVLTVITISLGIVFLSNWIFVGVEAKVIIICIMAGGMGSSISALISAAERIAHGWELDIEGETIKYPNEGPKDKFVSRMVPFFMIRPFFGFAMGLVVYLGIQAGYLIAVSNQSEKSLSLEGLMFLSFLAGLFAKTFIEKLRDMFDAFFGKTQKSKDN